MSLNNEERLLTELLGEVADADARLSTPDDLESRLLGRWDARDGHSLISSSKRWTMDGGRWTIALAIAAALVLAIASALRMNASPDEQPTGTIEIVDRKPPVVIAKSPEEETPAPPNLVRRSLPGRTMSRQRPATPPSEVLSFVPLMPMTEHELSGSFQLVRVQIGNTPADVLLGEDGMARAIRVSSSDASAPWRSR